jgi:hypothetical protein
MLNRIHLCIFLLVAWIHADENADSKVVVLDNGSMRMEINLLGGAISSCRLSEVDLNPFSWESSWKEGDFPRKEGFFTCFDRVGHSSQEDKLKGIPFHGEATSEIWELLGQSVDTNGNLLLRMRCQLPIAKMSLVREYCLFKDSSVCRVIDRFKNNNTFRKSYNILQHPSLGAPFLDETVLVDCNGETGFMNSKILTEMPGPILSWPEVRYQDQMINLRFLKDKNGLVANYVCADDEKYGWGCVSNPGRGLLVGCLWPTADYPWIRVWRAWGEAGPNALGVEFGTTPLGVPMNEVQAMGDLLGRPIFETLDPGAETEKTFYLYLANIPSDFTGVEAVSLIGDTLMIEPCGSAKAREWILPFERP